jgi:type I restriction-modification system DNA methylase subunit
MSDIVQKLWGFCHTLRHDGVDYGDYIEQLTYLLFLKMADEKAVATPKGCDWTTLKALSGTKLTDHYGEVLRKLRESDGLLGAIFTQATSRFNNPVNLRRLIDMIDEEEWSALDVDVKGAAFEGLLEKAASEGKKGAGQYFTPRPLIKSICRVMKPDPRGKQGFTIADPACGTGGFLVSSYEWLVDVSKGVFDRSDARRIRTATYYGQELVPRPLRLALMNLYLHGVEPHIYLGDTLYEPDRGERYDVVLTNPPFGTKGVRRVVCGLTTKAYNRFFAQLVANLRENNDNFSASAIRQGLLAETADSQKWPNDSEFRDTWMNIEFYRRVKQSVQRMILEAMEASLHTGKTEKVKVEKKLTIEHLLPREWEAYWPLVIHESG